METIVWILLFLYLVAITFTDKYIPIKNKHYDDDDDDDSEYYPRPCPVDEYRTIDKNTNPEIGELIEYTPLGPLKSTLFLKAESSEDGAIYEEVPFISNIDGSPIRTALAAQIWRKYGKKKNT